MSKTAVVLMAEGTEEIEAITAADVLQRAGVDVTIVGVNGTEFMGGHHIPLKAECGIEDVAEVIFDAVIVPGGAKGAEHMHKSAEVTELIMRHHHAGKIIAAICASPAVVLGPLGIMSGKHATCFPGLERRLPQDVKFCDTTVVVDGKLVTSRAPGTAMEFALKLASLLAGAEVALKLKHQMLVELVG